MKTPTHKINETHLGTDATHAQAERMAEILTEMGYPSEYHGMQGVSSDLSDPETGETVEIPDEAWQQALQQIK